MRTSGHLRVINFSNCFVANQKVSMKQLSMQLPERKEFFFSPITELYAGKLKTKINLFVMEVKVLSYGSMTNNFTLEVQIFFFSDCHADIKPNNNTHIRLLINIKTVKIRCFHFFFEGGSHQVCV